MNMKNFGRIKTIIIGLFGLSLVVIVHEFGHFLACKLFNIATPIFSIGFDPKIFAIKIGSTSFQIGALPLGGYTSIDPQELAAAPYYQKMIIILAGIFFNVLFAFGVFFFMLLRSTQKPIPVIESIKPDSAAALSDLHEGDRIISFDNEPVGDSVTSFFQQIAANPGKTVIATIERNNQQLVIPITLASEHPLYGADVGYLGATLKTITVPRPSLIQILSHTKLYIAHLFKSMSSVMSSIFKKNGNKSGIVGPLGIISGIGKSAEYGLNAFLFFLAIISLNLAFFNILPIPFFDGGKALQFTIEALIGHPLPLPILSFIYILFFILLMLLTFFLTVGDIRSLRKK